MDNNVLNNLGIVNTLMNGNKQPPEEENPEITTKLRRQWNEYVDWLEKKGMKGHKNLDKEGLGFKMIDEYRKENPDTLISKETIAPIQKEMSKYRDYTIGEISAKRAGTGGGLGWNGGVTPDNYMKNLSVVDGYPGQLTTSWKFPISYLETVENGKVVARDKSFAKIPDKGIAASYNNLINSGKILNDK